MEGELWKYLRFCRFAVFFFSFDIIFDNNYNKLSLWVARDCWTNIRTSFVPIIWMSQKDRDMDWVPDGWYTVWGYRVQTDDTICVHIRIIHRTTREKLWWQHCCSFWVAWVGQPPDIEPVNEVLEAHSAVVSQQCTIVTTKTTDDDGNDNDSLPMRRHSG